MAFPSVTDRQSSEEATTVTTHDITLPTVANGDLCIVKLGLPVGGGLTVSWSGTGFTLITGSEAQVGGSAHTISCAYRFCDGSEGATIQPTSSVASRSVAQALTITGHDTGTAPQAAAATITNNNPNPPSLSPTGGAKDYLWIACGAQDRSDTNHDINAAPTNYSNLEVLNQSGGASAGFGVGATAERQLNAATEDPGPFGSVGAATTGEGCAVTIAVHPAGAAAAEDPPPIIGSGYYGMWIPENWWERIFVPKPKVVLPGLI